MKEIGVYVLTDARTGKFYVGSSEDIDKRIKRHLYDLRRNQHHCPGLQDLWSKNGRIVETRLHVLTIEEARELEQDLLDRFKDSDQLLNIGLHSIGGDNLTRHPRREEIVAKIKQAIVDRMYAMTPLEKKMLFGLPGAKNGMWGKTHTPEAREKISASAIGHQRNLGIPLSEEHRKKISERAKLRVGDLNPFYGKSHSEETKKLLSEANKGKLPPNTRKISIDGVEYKSLTEASRILQVTPALIVYRMKSGNPKYAGYKYQDERSTTIPAGSTLK